MADIWMDVDAALAEVPVNRFPLLDDTDFKTIETGVAYNAAGLSLSWHFVTPAGAYTRTAVTPTTGGDYDWAEQGAGFYSIEIPASGGASINNDTEGFGWFSGIATGILPWVGPIIGFRAAGLNDAMIESAYSTTRGLAGTALPNAAADAAGGLVISDAGGVDIDALVTAVSTILGLQSVTYGTAQGAGTGSDTMQLAAGQVTTDDLFNGFIVAIVSGAGAGQQRAILDSVQSNNQIQVDGGNWDTAVDNTSVYVIFGN